MLRASPSRPVARLAFALLCCAAASPARADLIRLKNGAVIKADTWEASGDVLIIHQGTGRITVPRADVLRIDPETPTAPGSAAGGAGTPAAGASPASPPDAGSPSRGDAPAPTDDQIRDAIDRLKKRIADYPLTRAENTRRIVALFNQLGARALKTRDYDAALARFREATSYDPHDAHAQLGMATVYVRTDQDIFARSTLERALVDHPEDAALHALLGDVYYGQERTEEALAEWRKANELTPGQVVQSKIDKAIRERSIDGAYRQSDAAHFTLKYDGERAGPDLGGQILDYLEGQFRNLETRFDHYPLQPIVVILYPQRQFHEATLADASVAGLFDGKIRVPIGGLQQLNADARRVLLHEMAHAFIAGKSHGAAPRWLHEGLAQLVEGKRTPSGGGAALAREYQALQDKTVWGEDFSYPSALSFVEYLDGRLGFPVLVDVLGTMARAPGDGAFETVTRYSLQELRLAWGEALVRKYLQ